MNKSKLFGVLLALISLGCNSEYIPRENIQITINEFRQDSTSIRAIDLLNDSTLIYAGSLGDIGALNLNGKLRTLNYIKRDSLTPHFRSVVAKKDAVFALAIASPTQLYKIRGDEAKLVYQEDHELAFYDSMKFFDAMHGIAMGDPTDSCLSILITNDGGNIWSKVDCAELPPAFEGEAAFAASNTNIAIYKDNVWIVTGGTHARVFHSSDKGANWQVYPTPIIQGKQTTGIYSVDFFDASTGIICGGDYTDKFGKSANKALTTDGGKTWALVGEGAIPHYISCVQYIPETQGKEVMAVSTNGIFYSSNGGIDFSQVSKQGYYALKFFDQNTAWLSGNEVIAKMEIQHLK